MSAASSPAGALFLVPCKGQLLTLWGPYLLRGGVLGLGVPGCHGLFGPRQGPGWGAVGQDSSPAWGSWPCSGHCTWEPWRRPGVPPGPVGLGQTAACSVTEVRRSRSRVACTLWTSWTPVEADLDTPRPLELGSQEGGAALCIPSIRNGLCRRPRSRGQGKGPQLPRGLCLRLPPHRPAPHLSQGEAAVAGPLASVSRTSVPRRPPLPPPSP